MQLSVRFLTYYELSKGVNECVFHTLRLEWFYGGIPTELGPDPRFEDPLNPSTFGKKTISVNLPEMFPY